MLIYLELRRCEQVLTQNPNESLHSVIWNMAPKHRFTSSTDNNIAMCLGVAMFNDGLHDTLNCILRGLGIPPSKHSKKIWIWLDKKRVGDVLYQDSAVRKDRRKKIKREKTKKESAFQHHEGETYKRETFYNL